MKKIVAVVLALVMVLGLSTVAFGAATSKTYEDLYFQTTADGVKHGQADAVVYDEVAPKYTDKGVLSLNGYMAYAEVAGVPYVIVNTLAEADAVAYIDEYKTVKFYLAYITDSRYYEGVAFTNFGKSCGQVNLGTAFDKDETYYTVKGVEDFYLYVSAENGAYNLKVGNQYVKVNYVAAAKNLHKPVAELTKGEYTKIYCSVCGAEAVKAANFLSIPKGADTTGLTGYGNWYWGTTAATSTDTKVESAETFDAGIAMYVGMSVLAAAGSAVVIGKKKD